MTVPLMQDLLSPVSSKNKGYMRTILIHEKQNINLFLRKNMKPEMSHPLKGESVLMK